MLTIDPTHFLFVLVLHPDDLIDQLLQILLFAFDLFNLLLKFLLILKQEVSPGVEPEVLGPVLSELIEHVSQCSFTA